MYYRVKLEAAQLLIDNVDNTFVTPVFNGSASLRNAAGQLIEEVAKSARRKKTVDDEYIEKLYGDVSSLYHLDRIEAGGASASVKKTLGPLPVPAVVLLSSLGCAWTGIVCYILFETRKKYRN